MTARHLEANVRPGPGIAIIDLHGQIDGFADERINAAYAEATAGNPAAIALNFGDVDYINSTGIALIVGLLAQARRTGRRVLTYGLSDHYRSIFQITRLDDAIAIHDSEEEAVRAANSA